MDEAENLETRSDPKCSDGGGEEKQAVEKISACSLSLLSLSLLVHHSLSSLSSTPFVCTLERERVREDSGEGKGVCVYVRAGLCVGLSVFACVSVCVDSKGPTTMEEASCCSKA